MNLLKKMQKSNNTCNIHITFYNYSKQPARISKIQTVSPFPLSNNTMAELGALTLQTGVRNRRIWRVTGIKIPALIGRSPRHCVMLDITNIQNILNIPKSIFLIFQLFYILLPHSSVSQELPSLINKEFFINLQNSIRKLCAYGRPATHTEQNI